MFLTAMVFLASLASVSADDCTLTTTTNSLKVMSFNVRTSQANDPCPAGCWELRKSRVQRMLATHDPDFIGTQETAPDQTQFFRDTLGYAAVGECAGPCNGNERDAIFFRSSKWEVLASHTFALSDTPEILGSNTWNLEYLRAAVLARFRSKLSGNTICLLNTHYDISRGQEQSSVLVAKRLAQFCQPFDSVIMTGDLNTPPQTAAIQYLENKTPLSGASTPLPLYETLAAAGAGGPTWIGGSFGSQPVGAKIDYVFARNDSQTCLQRGQIITDAFDGYTSSDHAAVMSTFCMGTGGCSGCM